MQFSARREKSVISDHYGDAWLWRPSINHAVAQWRASLNTKVRQTPEMLTSLVKWLKFTGYDVCSRRAAAAVIVI